MRRYWIDESCIQKDLRLVVITGEQYHHICQVCRMHVGSRFEVIVGDGKAYFVEIQEIVKKSAIAKIVDEREIPAIQKPYIHVKISLPKIATFESVLEKLVEMGVSSVEPFVSQYSFIREKTHKSLDKYARFQKIIQSATEQSGRGHLMEIQPVSSLQEILEKINRNSDAMGLFAYEGDSVSSIQSALREIKGQKPENIWLFVGSEGGFSTQEVDLFAENGLKSVSLGDRVLRVETACLALVSSIKYEFEI